MLRSIDSLFLLERGQELRLANASIALGQAAELEALPAFKVQGYLEDFQLELGKQWLARYEEHQAQLAQVTGQPSSQTRDTPGRIAGLPLQAELLLGRYQLGALSLNDLQVSATRDWLGWHLKLNNQTLAGSLMIPNASIRPLQIKLDYLRLTREQLGLPEVSVNESGIEEGAAEDVAAKTEAMAAITQPLRAQLDRSSVRTSTIARASLSLTVIALSALLGSGMPLGWLWAKITAAALSRNASLTTSRGYTGDASIVPLNISTYSISLC